jgi:hypothetical protein
LPVAGFQAMPRGSPIEFAMQAVEPAEHVAGIEDFA